MIRRHGAGLRVCLMLADVGVAAVLAVVISALMFASQWLTTWEAILPSPFLGLVLFVFSWVLMLWLHGQYRLRARWSVASDARSILRAALWFGLVTFAFLYFARLEETSRVYIVTLLVALSVVTVVERALLRWMFEVIRRQGGNARYVLVLGTGPLARDFAAKLEGHRELGLRIAGFLGAPTPELPARWPHLGPYEDLPEVLHNRVIDEIAICVTPRDWRVAEEVVRLCETEGRVARMPLLMPALTIARSHVEDLDGTPVVSFLTGPRPVLSLAIKRTLDLLAGSVGMILLLPLFAGISIAILLDSGRPIFFRQDRVGLHGRRFSVVKFRTMVRDAEARLEELKSANEVNGHAFKLTLDPRVTGVGSFLRRSSLDELPQLWNVLRGDMSLVGPRPPLPTEVAGYDLWHRRRLSMKPGVTGLWQIEGRREVEFDRWVQKDLEYIDRWSPWLDIKILLRTIPAIIRAEGR
jgi:exopolysaccharide biosynthesis polyprenyl glycosylphosphotransferase